MLRAVGWMTLVGAVVGIAVGLFSAGALNASGFTSANLPPLVAPTEEPTTTATPTPEPTTSAPETGGPQPTLQRVDRAAPGERFPIVGRLPQSKDGAALQIQVKEGDGPWDEFPVDLSASSGGRFETKIWTSRTGERTLRVVDDATGEKTPEITVTIG